MRVCHGSYSPYHFIACSHAYRWLYSAYLTLVADLVGRLIEQCTDRPSE
jgi:hypothetical protein